ncbi:MAG: 4Fe-4S binding protein [Chloroflexota bacterium]|nr:4Fe-4S binding protein [Chloroflexota bacterium]
MADLSVEFAGVRFKNPVLVGSGEPTYSIENMRQCIEAGAGGIVAKSVSNSPGLRRMFSTWRILNEKHEVARGKVPRLFTFYARGGASRKTLDEWLAVLKEGKKIADAHDAVLIGSAMGPDISSWREQCQRMEDIGIRMAELNFGCPHPASMKLEHKEGMEIGQDVELSAEIVRAVTGAVSIPVIVKLTPQVPDVVEIAQKMKESGAAGVTMFNRFVGFVVDVEAAKPVIEGWAGVGGPWVKPLTLRWISKVYAAMNDFPVSGSNGPYDWKDVVEFMMSGATTVQLCTVFLVKGLDYVKDVVAGLNAFLDRKGYKSAREIIGLAAKQALLYDDIFRLGRVRATIDEARCTACGICLRSCMFRAIQSEDGRYRVSQDNCAGCELCFSLCPADAIRFVPAPVSAS